MLERVFGIDSAVVLLNPTAREIIEHMVAQADKVRLVYFLGHFARGGFLTGDERVLTPERISNAFARPSVYTFGTRPLVFLNGCQSGGTDRSRLPPELDANRDMARAFLNLGAGACIVTSADVRQRYAVQFLTTFLTHLLMPGASVGSALLRARNGMDKDRSYEWATYHLLGDPGYIMLHDDVDEEEVRPAGGPGTAGGRHEKYPVTRESSGDRRGGNLSADSVAGAQGQVLYPA